MVSLPQTDLHRGDTPVSEMLAELRERRRQALSAMSDEERLRDFLGLCNRRGSRYRPGKDPLPTHSQLAKYCECEPSTIYRIAVGKTKSPSVRTTRILRAIACIDPPFPFDGISEECRARLADADRWLESDPRLRGDVIDAILAGIRSRQAALLN